MSDAAEAPGRLERREELRDQLLIAAEQLLTRDGYTELSIDRLVAGAAVGRSTFYKYFDDKSELLGLWFMQISGQLSGSMRAWLDIDADVTHAQLAGVLTELVGAYLPHAPLMATLYDIARYDTALASVITAVESRTVAELAGHIEAGQRGGWIDPELLAEETASWLSWLGERGQHQLLRTVQDCEAVTRLGAAYAEIVWSTLYAFAPARAAR